MMLEFDHYSQNGKTLMAGFTCQRCRATAVAPLKDCVPGDEGDRFIRNLKPPKGWSDHFYGWLLCPECTNKLKDFIETKGDVVPTLEEQERKE